MNMVTKIDLDKKSNDIINTNYRSSTIFPVFFRKGVSCKISFFSYWHLKNKLTETNLFFTIRKKNGDFVGLFNIKVSDPKSFNIDISKLIEDKFSKKENGDFKFSVEVEAFFQKEARFNYPAITMSISSDFGTTFVHSCSRIYNENEKPSPEIIQAQQTGFNIFYKEKVRNYMVFVCSANIKLYDFVFTLNEKIEKKIIIKQKYPYEMIEIDMTSLFSRNELKEHHSKLKIKHNLEEEFPRFYIGNYCKEYPPTLTHSFFEYDQEINGIEQKGQSDKDYYDSSFIYPILTLEKYETKISSYACNALWHGNVLIEIIDDKGTILLKKNFLSNPSGFLQNISKFDVTKLLTDKTVFKNKTYFCKVSMKEKSGLFPSRFKLGLDYYRKNLDRFGSNICFSPFKFSLNEMKKPFGSFWGPVGGIENYSLYFHNTDFSKFCDDIKNNLNYKIVNNKGEVKEKQLFIKKNETVFISKSMDEDLDKFLNNDVGWIFFQSDNIYANGWYISIGDKFIGGDHLY